VLANTHCLELTASEVSFNTIEEISGTTVTVELKKIMHRSLNSVFEDYCHVDENEIPVFDRTVFRLQLAQSEGRLISRSQAKRVMNGMERFNIVEVDFTGVNNIGQGFADEMFRVWQSFHQDTIIKTAHVSDKIKKIILRVKNVNN